MGVIVPIRRKVVAISSPGASLALPDSEGIITSIEETRFGKIANVRWIAGEKEGYEEPFTLHSIKENVRGIGVYYAE